MADFKHVSRRSPIFDEVSYELSENGLMFEVEQESKIIPYTEIQSLRLLVTPGFGWGANRKSGKGGELLIVTKDHNKLRIVSHYFGSFAKKPEHRSSSYNPFVCEFARRVFSANPTARFVAGDFWFRLFWILFSLVMFVGLLAIAFFVSFSLIYTWPDGVGPTRPFFASMAMIVAIVPIVASIFLGLRHAECLLPQTFDPKAISEKFLPRPLSSMKAVGT